MKVKFRTVLLVFLFIKLCILFTVLQESIESLSSNDHPLLFGTNDIYLFDMMLAAISGLSMLLSALYIILFAIGHTRIRKPYVVVAFVINLMFVVPFFLSGVYLVFQDDHDLKLTSKVTKSFESVFDFAETYNLNASQQTASTKPPPNKGVKNQSSPNNTVSGPKLPIVNPDLMKHFDVVDHIQRRYCCCGLNGGIDYGFDNETTASTETIPFTSKLDIRCPHNSLFKNSTCGDTHNKGCENRLKQVYPTRILIYSCIGTAFSVIFALVSPLIYSQFELDRRRARAKYIRDWRHSIETFVADQRLWALRKTKKSSDTSSKKKQSPVSPAVVSYDYQLMKT
ncbi:hypothetical protein GCK72_018299 [Caenorhabditis remanei]|uniref:Uncharacterized protein n=1 Tax=Caenorhabditis remanei TaxID=31234 RepID=A0A6A5GAT1_CAERE|nr:hypothetical protein GCK72_018299 [Caenorhabditis remanei]KAF1751745.1 hypothetical protein GCK72_018299 [Caenorhabditis remanei]